MPLINDNTLQCTLVIKDHYTYVITLVQGSLYSVAQQQMSQRLGQGSSHIRYFTSLELAREGFITEVNSHQGHVCNLFQRNLFESFPPADFVAVPIAPTPELLPSPTLPTDLHCPRCNAPMERRHSRRNNRDFWGCSNYPACRGSRNYNTPPQISASPSPTSELDQRILQAHID